MRVGLFCFYDAEGKVDRYIDYMLKQLQPYLDRLVIVANGKLSEEGEKLLSLYSSEVMVRENKGYDVTAYKAGIDYLGYEALTQCDELLVFNDSVYGPIFPFCELFDTMSSRTDLDFWGITGCREQKEFIMPDNPCGYACAHIQSYFTVFRKKLLASGAFQEYWEKFPEIKSRQMAVERHEAYITYYLEQKGFKWGTYVPIAYEKNIPSNQISLEPLEIIKKYRCPVFKRSVFSADPCRYLNDAGENGYQIKRYIERNCNYDFRLAEEHLLRVSSLSSLIPSLNLFQIIPESPDQEIGASKLRSAAFAHLYAPEDCSEIMEQCSNLPPETDLYVSCSVPDIIALQKQFSTLENKVEIHNLSGEGGEITAYFVDQRETIKNYDVVLFLHDTVHGNSEIRTNAESFRYKLTQSLLPSCAFARGVIRCFERNPYLGILAPTPPIHGIFGSLPGMEWEDCFHTTLSLLKQIGVERQVSETVSPIPIYENMFWFRPAALFPLLEYPWNRSDFTIDNGDKSNILRSIERCYAFVAQSRGYYFSYLSSDHYIGVDYSVLSSYNGDWNKLTMNYGLCGRVKERQILMTSIAVAKIWIKQTVKKILLQLHFQDLIKLRGKMKNRQIVRMDMTKPWERIWNRD